MSENGMIQCRCCDGTGKVKCRCERLSIVEGHPLNTTDYQGPSGSQGYSVKRCRDCGRIWAVRWQFDPGTGSDNHHKDYGFGDPLELVKERHY